MTQLYLVRHGQTDWNAERRWQGQKDTSLNETGRREARAVAEAFRGVPVGHIFSSDLSRAFDTAAAIAAVTGVPHTALPSLRERAFGRWEGMTNAELAERYPGEMERYQADRDGFEPPGGESWNEFARKSAATFEDIAASHPGQTLVIVAHGGPIKAFVNHVLGCARGQTNTFLLENGSITTVRRRAHEITGRVWWQVTALNITSHLNTGHPLRRTGPS